MNVVHVAMCDFLPNSRLKTLLVRNNSRDALLLDQIVHDAIHSLGHLLLKV